MVGIQRGDGFEHFQFAGRGESIAGFDLDGGGTVGQHAIQARASLGHQLCEGCGAGGAHGGHDAAASGHNLHVGRAAHALLELGGPFAGPHNVGVGVHEAGADDFAGTVQFDGGLPGSAHLGCGTDGDDAPVNAGHRPILNESQASP